MSIHNSNNDSIGKPLSKGTRSSQFKKLAKERMNRRQRALAGKPIVSEEQAKMRKLGTR